MSSEPAGAPIGVDPRPAPRPEVRSPGRLRSVIVVALFAAGVLGGIGLQRATDPPLGQVPWPPLENRGEPAAARELAAAIAANDANALARLLNPTAVTALGEALDPIVEVTDIKLLGAVGHPDDELAAYLVRGVDQRGQALLVGFALHVMNGRVASVNR